MEQSGWRNIKKCNFRFYTRLIVKGFFDYI